MKQAPNNKILARATREDFVGRQAELDRLISHGAGDSLANLVVLAAPRSGASELLRQLYDRLFAGEADTDIAPFYFEVRAGDASAREAAFRFAYQFIVQTVA